MSDLNSDPSPPICLVLKSCGNQFIINRENENQSFDFPPLINFRLNSEVKNAIKSAVENPEPTSPVPNLGTPVANLGAPVANSGTSVATLDPPVSNSSPLPDLGAPVASLEAPIPNFASQLPNLGSPLPNLEVQLETVVENGHVVENGVETVHVTDEVENSHEENQVQNCHVENEAENFHMENAAQNHKVETADPGPSQNNDHGYHEELFSDVVIITQKTQKTVKKGKKRSRISSSSDSDVPRDHTECKRVCQTTQTAEEKPLDKNMTEITIKDLKKIIRQEQVFKIQTCCDCSKRLAESEEKHAALEEKYKQLVKIAVRLNGRMTEGKARPAVFSVGTQCSQDDAQILSTGFKIGGETSLRKESPPRNRKINGEVILDANGPPATTSKVGLMVHPNNAVNPLGNSMSKQFRTLPSRENQMPPLKRAPAPRLLSSTGFVVPSVSSMNGHVTAVLPRITSRDYTGIPKPVLSWSRIQGLGIQLMWDHETCFLKIASYHLFAYQTDCDRWKQIGEIAPLPLPMACTLTELNAKERYLFAIRGVDEKGRFGPLSYPCEIRPGQLAV